MSGPELKSTAQILFVCEHGNAKSLMAACYLNRIAEARHLPVRAVARGVAPDSETVPMVVSRGLLDEGFDVSGFHPRKVQPADLESSTRVVVIGTSMPVGGRGGFEVWIDVPAASEDFQAASRELKRHIEELLSTVEIRYGPNRNDKVLQALPR